MNACTADLATAVRPHAATAARVDVYLNIHKALRLFMQQTLVRLGRIDVENEQDFRATLDDVDALLDFMHGHVQHENDFVHPFIEARRPGGARVTIGDHREHVETLAALQGAVVALSQAAPVERGARALSLYRQLAVFVGENLGHMHQEETVNNAALWAAYTDAEIDAMHQRLVQSLSPDDMMKTIRFMAAASTPQELIGLLREMQAGMPPPVFASVLDVVRRQLDERRWARVAQALGVAAVPGLVDLAG